MIDDPIVLVDGIRTPFCKAGGVFKEMEADDLGAFAVKELLARVDIAVSEIDEVIFGNVIQPPNAANIARIVAVKAGIPTEVPAFTVNRNCASGMEAIVSGMNRIQLGHADVIVAGGCESMSNFPVLYPRSMREWLLKISKAKSVKDRLGLLFQFPPSFLYPQIPSISDPLCGQTMGKTAENLAREYHITRKEQDKYALRSQERAVLAIAEGKFTDEIIPIPYPPKYNEIQVVDDGPRPDTTMEALERLRPAFDKVTATVTPGNSSQVTDGACALLLMRKSKADALGLKPLGILKEYASAGVEPSRMGIGPVLAVKKLLKQVGLSLDHFDLIEINEAFAAQVLAVSKELGVNMDRLNVNGGAIALGHPIGVSGSRIVLSLLKELKRRGKKHGLATLCVGGGQGEALIVEAIL
ncbi:MAG: thiolase family protein [Waddliaceae bacterium]